MMLDRAEVESIKAQAGHVRGAAMRTDESSLLNRGGLDSVTAVEAILAEEGFPYRLSEIKGMAWYPLPLRLLSLLAMREVLQLDDEGLRSVGSRAPAFSSLMKLFMKFFASAQQATARSPQYWEMHYDVGKMDSRFVSESEGVDLALSDFIGHPAFCRYLEGYFCRLFQIVNPDKSDSIAVTETSCIHSGQNVHRFEIRWG